MWQPAQSTKLPDFGAGAAKMRGGGRPKTGPLRCARPQEEALLGNSVVPHCSWEKKSKNRNKKLFSLDKKDFEFFQVTQLLGCQPHVPVSCRPGQEGTRGRCLRQQHSAWGRCPMVQAPTRPGAARCPPGNSKLSTRRLFFFFFLGQSNYFQAHLFDFSVKEIFSLSQVVFT